jgi:gluconate 5-dehydrogenase
MTPAHPFSLAGQVALVTGAARGLGFEVAKAMALAGARVVLNGRQVDALSEAVEAIRASGGEAEASAFDVADTEAVEQAVARIVQDHGRLDVLVNNVGQRDRRELFAFSLDEVRALLEIDLIAPFHLSRVAAQPMIRQRCGRILNVTSIAGPIARSGDAPYTTAKGGLEALTRALAAELGVHGVTANAVAPGFFATAANAQMAADDGVRRWLEQRTSLQRWGEPHEFAGAVVFLASPAAAYITGQVLAVDGGYLAHF